MPPMNKELKGFVSSIAELSLGSTCYEKHADLSHDTFQVESKREQLRREVIDLLGDDGVLIFPSFATSAPYHRQPLSTMYNFAYTALWNSLALPAISCPMGLNAQGIPLGVQVVAAPDMERLLIKAAQDLEEGFGGWTPPQNSYRQPY